MMNTRSIALVIGLLGAGLGLAAAVADSAVLGVGAGAAALCAGVLAVAGPSSDPEAEAQVALLEARVGERDEELARTRTSLTDTRARLAELEGRLGADAGSGSAATTDPPPARRGDEPVVLSDGTSPTRSAGEGQAPPPPDRGSPPTAPTAEEALTDAETQLFSEAYFRVALDARIASARRHLRPVAIALLDVHEGQAAAGAHRCDPRRTAESLRETVRDADTACRLDDGNFAIILEDTPENGAVWTVERVRRNLVSRFGTHTMWAGVACYPAHAFSAAELVEQARVALSAAREWKQDRIEVAIAD